MNSASGHRKVIFSPRAARVCNGGDGESAAACSRGLGDVYDNLIMFYNTLFDLRLRKNTLSPIFLNTGVNNG